MMFSIFPFPHGLLIKDDSMRKWSKEHKNYIQLQVTVKEFGGQEPALFSMPSSPTFSYPIWVTAWTSNGQSGRSRYTPYSPTCTPANSLGILIKPNVWHFRIVRSKSKRGFQNLALSNSKFSPWPSCHIKQVTLSKIQAKGATGSPFPPPVQAHHCHPSSLHKSYVTAL